MGGVLTCGIYEVVPKGSRLDQGGIFFFFLNLMFVSFSDFGKLVGSRTFQHTHSRTRVKHPVCLTGNSSLRFVFFSFGKISSFQYWSLRPNFSCLLVTYSYLYISFFFFKLRSQFYLLEIF